jgi:nucleotide-binding universal stress UspA family protein
MKTAIETASSASLLTSPSNIVVATDLTELDRLLPHAVAQGQRTRAQITLVHALAVPDGVILGAKPTAKQIEIRDRACHALNEAARTIQGHGIGCSVVVREGCATEVVLEEMNARQATRLLIGTHSHGYAGQKILGHVANSLLRAVNLPVFAVGPHVAPSSEHAIPRCILHPVSLTGSYRKTAAFALQLARSYDADLTLVHVLDSGILRGSYVKEIRERKRRELAALIPDEYPISRVRTMVACGELVLELMKKCSTTCSDWVVIGVEHDFPWWSMSNNTAYQVIAQAECPVITFRPEANACEPRQTLSHTNISELSESRQGADRAG